MVLVDTSVWVDHLRAGDAELGSLLNESQVACHPFIIGELACGDIKNRREILSLLQALPIVTIAQHDEVMRFVENHKLMGRGIGYVDVHLLTSAALTGIRIWTFDKKLNEVALELAMGFNAAF